MDIIPNGSVPSTRGSAENFTGYVRIDPLFHNDDSAMPAVSLVTFEPAARTAWHSHDLGQILIITSGLGLVQQIDGPVKQVRPGDVVWIPPGEKHWHGASLENAMTHIAIYQHGVNWMEKVSDRQYKPK